MNPWIAAVLIAFFFTLVVAIGAVLTSISAVKDLARSARRFQEEVGGLAADIGGDADRLTRRTAALQPPGATGGGDRRG